MEAVCRPNSPRTAAPDRVMDLPRALSRRGRWYGFRWSFGPIAPEPLACRCHLALTEPYSRNPNPLLPIFLIASGIVLLSLLCVVHSRLAARLREAERLSAATSEQAHLLDLAHGAILSWDLHSGAIRFWNRGAEELYGWRRADVLGRTPQDVLQTRFPRPLAEINAELIENGRWEGELVHTRRSGTPVVVASRWALMNNAQGKPTAILGINTDITARKHAEAALEHQAWYDGLTGLPNRALFRDRLEGALARAHRHNQRVGVLFLDLDNFKVINDGLGHEAGDLLLVEVAHRLRTCV